MWELDYKESWAPKNWWFWTVVLEKSLESPLNCKVIKPVNSKVHQLWIFFGRTDAETEAPILWPSVAKSWLIEKDYDAGKDWGQEEKGMKVDEMIWWHHELNGHEFYQTLGDSEGWGSLACCSPQGHKESDMTQWLTNNKSTTHTVHSPTRSGIPWEQRVSCVSWTPQHLAQCLKYRGWAQ